MFPCSKCSEYFSTNSNRLKHDRNMHSKEKEQNKKKIFEQSPDRPMDDVHTVVRFALSFSQRYRIRFATRTTLTLRFLINWLIVPYVKTLLQAKGIWNSTWILNIVTKTMKVCIIRLNYKWIDCYYDLWWGVPLS